MMSLSTMQRNRNPNTETAWAELVAVIGLWCHLSRPYEMEFASGCLTRA
jgi:hypothetical protein